MCNSWCHLRYFHSIPCAIHLISSTGRHLLAWGSLGSPTVWFAQQINKWISYKNGKYCLFKTGKTPAHPKHRTKILHLYIQQLKWRVQLPNLYLGLVQQEGDKTKGFTFFIPFLCNICYLQFCIIECSGNFGYFACGFLWHYFSSLWKHLMCCVCFQPWGGLERNTCCKRFCVWCYCET